MFSDLHDIPKTLSTAKENNNIETLSKLYRSSGPFNIPNTIIFITHKRTRPPNTATVLYNNFKIIISYTPTVSSSIYVMISLDIII